MMRWDDLYVSACAAWLGDVEDVQVGVDQERYDPQERADDGYVSVRVAGDRPPGDMAVAAGNLALERAALSHDDFVTLIHACVAFQGLDYWASASYVQSRTIGGRASAVEVRQASDGGMAALDLAAAQLAVRPSPAAVLITTADRYELPAFDRYRSDKNIVRGDGATGLVLSRDPGGVARLLSTVVIGDTEHEGLYRGPWNAFSGADGRPVDLRSRTQAYLQAGVSLGDFVDSLGRGQHDSIQAALDDAGIGGRDVGYWVFPHAGLKMVDWDRRKREFGIEEDRTTWSWGRTVGHIGAGDQFAGLTRLLETKAVGPGDHVVLVGIGAGFTFGCAVVEILRRPEWPASAT
jgi:3-oxoacyl-[acyl-carrier-protein] synthase-3